MTEKLSKITNSRFGVKLSELKLRDLFLLPETCCGCHVPVEFHFYHFNRIDPPDRPL